MNQEEIFMVGDRVTLVPGAEQKTEFAREGNGRVVSLEYGLERGALLSPRWYEIKWDNYPEESPFYYRRDLVIRVPIGGDKHQPYTLPKI